MTKIHSQYPFIPLNTQFKKLNQCQKFLTILTTIVASIFTLGAAGYVTFKTMVKKWSKKTPTPKIQKTVQLALKQENKFFQKTIEERANNWSLLIASNGKDYEKDEEYNGELKDFPEKLIQLSKNPFETHFPDLEKFLGIETHSLEEIANATLSLDQKTIQYFYRKWTKEEDEERLREQEKIREIKEILALNLNYYEFSTVLNHLEELGENPYKEIDFFFHQTHLPHLNEEIRSSKLFKKRVEEKVKEGELDRTIANAIIRKNICKLYSNICQKVLETVERLEGETPLKAPFLNALSEHDYPKSLEILNKFPQDDAWKEPLRKPLEYIQNWIGNDLNKSPHSFENHKAHLKNTLEVEKKKIEALKNKYPMILKSNFSEMEDLIKSFETLLIDPYANIVEDVIGRVIDPAFKDMIKGFDNATRPLIEHMVIFKLWSALPSLTDKSRELTNKIMKGLDEAAQEKMQPFEKNKGKINALNNGLKLAYDAIDLKQAFDIFQNMISIASENDLIAKFFDDIPYLEIQFQPLKEEAQKALELLENRKEFLKKIDLWKRKFPHLISINDLLVQKLTKKWEALNKKIIFPDEIFEMKSIKDRLTLIKNFLEKDLHFSLLKNRIELLIEPDLYKLYLELPVVDIDFEENLIAHLGYRYGLTQLDEVFAKIQAEIDFAKQNYFKLLMDKKEYWKAFKLLPKVGNPFKKIQPTALGKLDRWRKEVPKDIFKTINHWMDKDKNFLELAREKEKNQMKYREFLTGEYKKSAQITFGPHHLLNLVIGLPNDFKEALPLLPLKAKQIYDIYQKLRGINSQDEAEIVLISQLKNVLEVAFRKVIFENLEQIKGQEVCHYFIPHFGEVNKAYDFIKHLLLSPHATFHFPSKLCDLLQKIMTLQEEKNKLFLKGFPIEATLTMNTLNEINELLKPFKDRQKPFYTFKGEKVLLDLKLYERFASSLQAGNYLSVSEKMASPGMRRVLSAIFDLQNLLWVTLSRLM